MKKIILLSALSLLTLAACDSKQQDEVDAVKTQTAPAAVSPVEQQPEIKVEPVKVETVKEAPVKAEPVKEEPPAAKVSMAGDKVYAKSCVSCHGSGAAGAPKLGDKAAWSARIAKGNDTLYTSAIKGITGTAMLPKGTCAACSDDELKAAVDYMVAKSK